MKVQKMITIDVEVANELAKEKNASGLINSYLKVYYGIGCKKIEDHEVEDQYLNEEEIDNIFKQEVVNNGN